MDEINESPYSEFLESAVRYIIENKPKAVTLVAESDGDGPDMTAYYHAEAHNKMTAIMHILTDFIMEIIGNNREWIRQMIDGEDGTE